jgi:hypothetical protein
MVSPTGEETSLHFGGAPTCLAVRGNVATFNIRTDPLLSSDGWGDLFTLEVTDNAGKGKPDVVSAVPSVRAPGDCSPFDFAGVTSDVTQGDYTVTDISGPPRSAAACAHGRYKRLGFKSHRRCVAAARHAKHRHRHHRSLSHRRG